VRSVNGLSPIVYASFNPANNHQVLQLQMNDYQYHYLFASPVIFEIIDLSHILLIQMVYGDEMRYFTLQKQKKQKQKKDLETFDLEDFKYNFVNISAFRIVDAESNFTRHLLRDMEKFQPIGQSILNKSNIIQVCPTVPLLVILLIVYYLLYLLTIAIYLKKKIITKKCPLFCCQG
jgi:ionotropic kainate glutamate receptor 2